MKISRLSLVAVGLATVFFCQKALAQTPDFWKNKVSPELRAKLQTGERTDFFIVMAEQADISGAKNLVGKTTKAQYVFERLQAVASRSQANVTQVLRQYGAFFNSLYLVNAIAVQGGDLALAQTVAALPEVKRLALDPEVHFSGPVATADPASEAQNRGAIEWGINMINAPAVWALGYTGQGITVGGADTGYEWGHPAIKTQYRGYHAPTDTSDHNYNWHDAIHEASPLNGDNNNPCGFDSKQPCDDNNHGTHTMGTMTGDDGQGNQIGVAPGAKWVGCRNMERGWGKPSSYIECIEWFLAPTDLNGQNPDVSRAPHVINNSWYCSEEEGCVDTTVNNLIRTAIVNLRASGVVVVVSNGNFAQGGQCFTTRWAPAYFEESFSVGATDEADEITGFSSRGPIDIDGSNRIKPNVSAPGANVRSCVRGGDYANFWGTSMAGPHVAGLVALVLSAAPQLAGNVDVIEDIIESTAVEKFDPTACGGAAAVPNNAYGRGRINALAAVQMATSLNAPDVPGKPSASAQAFPNPAGERAIFDLKNFSGKAQLRIFDAAGRQVFGQNFAAQPRQLLEIPTQQLPEGVYFWQIRDEAQTVAGRLVRN
ncbi:MAG: S8 family peptidase [Saprospiraceae bacterium]